MSFNLGVEVGQILVLILVVPALSLALKHRAARRVVVVTASVLVAHTAWHWLVERTEKLHYVEWPEWDAAVTAGGLTALLGFLAWAGWLFLRQAERRRRSARPSSAE